MRESGDKGCHKARCLGGSEWAALSDRRFTLR
jgi:hypothetical protein